MTRPRKILSGQKGKDYSLASDYSLFSDILGDTELLKTMIPQSWDEIFEMAELVVPGIQDLQEPLNETWSLLKPVLLVNLARYLDLKTLY